MADLINYDDNLRKGTDKLNDSIKDANKAKVDAEQALTTANSAKQSADSTRTELNAVVGRETDSDAMSRQAAVDETGHDHQNLKARLDTQHQQVNSKLAQTLQVAETSTVTKNRIPENEIPSSRLATTSQDDRIKLVNLHEEVIQTMAGNTPVGSIPQNGSVTLETLAPQLRAMFIAEGSAW